jgi:hypothetical protein
MNRRVGHEEVTAETSKPSISRRTNNITKSQEMLSDSIHISLVEKADLNDTLALFKGSEEVSIEEEHFLIAGYEEPPPSYYVPRRYFVLLMLFLGVVVAYGLRVCISIAAAPVSAVGPGPPISIYNEYGWTDTVKGIVLSSFFYGWPPN